MLRAFIILLSIAIPSFLSAQTGSLCVEFLLNSDNLKNGSALNENCLFIDNEDAINKIEEIMSLAGLPMNFSVCKAGRINNAYAKVDSNGIRYIVYDEVFLKKLNSDEFSIETYTVLAHEIGHHLAAHTLNIADENFNEVARKYCLKDSPNFDSKKCKEQRLSFLDSRRQHELEADRFAGYIMCKFGSSFKQITSAFYKISSNYDDTESTHPNLNKRLDALKAGFLLAESDLKDSTKKINLQEIKGSKIDFVFQNLGELEKRELISKLKQAMTYDAMAHVERTSKHHIRGHGGWDGVNEPYGEKVRLFTGLSGKFWKIDTTTEYFEVLNEGIFLHVDPQIKFSPTSAIYIKDGILKLYTFSNIGPKPKLIYRSAFASDKVSFKEIETSFIELFRDGLQKEIDKHYAVTK